MSFVISGSYYYIFLGEFVIKHYISTKYTIVAIEVSFSKECLIRDFRTRVSLPNTGLYDTIDCWHNWHKISLKKARTKLVKWRTTAKLHSRLLARSDLDRIHAAIDGLLW
jgi:hypothetical protein